MDKMHSNQTNQLTSSLMQVLLLPSVVKYAVYKISYCSKLQVFIIIISTATTGFTFL
jgi:hypothetical protein